MADVLAREDAPKTWVDADGVVQVDRRRPGRRDEVDSSLVPLLRGEAPVADEPAEAELAGEPVFSPSRDDLKFAVGLRWGLCSVFAIWGGAAYLLLR